MNISPFIFYLIIVLVGFVFPKSKVVNILLCLVVIILFSLSEDDNDFWVYMKIYDEIGNGNGADYEVGYVFINSIFNKLGVDYITFRKLLGALFSVVLFFVIRKSTNSPNVVWGCYLIYSAMYDACLLRNSISMLLALLGIIFLEKTRGIKEYVISGLFFILASLFHSAYWAFLFFLPLWYVLNTKRGIKKFFVIVAISYIICIAANGIIFEVYSHFIIREATIDKYMTNVYSNINGAIYGLLKYLFIIAPVLFYTKLGRFETHRETFNGVISFNAQNSIIIKVNVIFCLILIPQFFAANFSRLFRILILINYIYLSTLSVKKQKINPRILSFTYAIILVILAVSYESPTTFVDIILMHFNTNPLFSFL